MKIEVPYEVGDKLKAKFYRLPQGETGDLVKAEPPKTETVEFRGFCYINADSFPDHIVYFVIAEDGTFQQINEHCIELAKEEEMADEQS